MGSPELARRPADRVSVTVFPASSGNARAVTPHFLVASDDDQLRESIHIVIRQLGFMGSFVRTAADAMAMTEARRVSLVVVDQHLPDRRGLDVARAISIDRPQQRFVLVGTRIRTSDTVEAMKLGALTVLEKPLTVHGIAAVIRSAVDPSLTGAGITDRGRDRFRSPRSVAERWAWNVLKGCEAEGDLRTLGAWAAFAGLSCSSLCESCRLNGVQPLASRDLMRVLRAVVQAGAYRGRIAELLDICDRRTLNALMARAGVDPAGTVSVDQFLTSQRFVSGNNAGLAIVRARVALPVRVGEISRPSRECR